MNLVQRTLAGALLTALLAGCTSPQASTNGPTPHIQPTSVALPTAVLQPTVPSAIATATAQAVPSAIPQTTRTLPAPLYFRDDHQQIVRLETDGVSRTTITNEPQGVAWFNVSPTDNTIVYATEASGSTPLVRIDARGEHRTEIAQGVIHVAQWSPDGQTLAIDWEDGPQGNGVYALAADGLPLLIVKAVPFNAATTTDGLRYSPLAWSPDGTNLLLRTAPDTGPDKPGGDVAQTGLVIANRQGTITELVKLGSRPYLCSQAFWNIDGTSVYCAQEGYAFQAPPLWRIPAMGGTPDVLVQPVHDERPLFFQTRQLANGGVYSFVGQETKDGTQLPFKMQRLNPDGSVASDLRSDTLNWIAVLPGQWAPDGSGAVVKDPKVEGDKGMLWLPTGTGAPVALPDAFQNFVQWGAQEH